MIHNHNVKIIAFVGLTGSGKSTAANYISNKNYPKVYFGNVILEKMKDQNIEINDESKRAFREDIRSKEGKDFVAKAVSKQIHDLIEAGQHRIVADGLYSWTEYKYLKHEFSGKLTVVAIVTSKKLRHQRLMNRPIQSLSQFEADQRDWLEIENLEKGGPIAIADHYLMNDNDLDNLYNQIDKLLIEIDFSTRF